MVIDDDPGWPLSFSVLLGTLPVINIFMRRRMSTQTDGLLAMRQIFLSFTVALVLFGVVLAALYPSSTPPENPPTVITAGLLVVSAAASMLARRFEQPLTCTDDAHLAMSYRTRFFLRIAFAEQVALMGFVGFFLTYAWWPYPAGVAVTALGFARAAPTKANLARDQEVLSQAGCPRSLVRALRGTGPTT